jgi:TorA maturation chaperone TorD
MTSPAATVERAATARLLSIGFSPPDAATLDELLCLAAALADGDGGDGPVTELALALTDARADEVAWEFESLFGGQVACSPYEAGYEPDPFRGTRQIADVAGFYRAFGATSDGPAAERPDHIACQLEFLAFLAARRVAATERGDGAEQAFLAGVEDDFLRSHLGHFMGPFCTAVEETTESPVFGALARLGARFIAAELAARDIEPPDLRRPGSTAVDGDEITCGMAGGCALTDIIGRSEKRAGPRRR